MLILQYNTNMNHHLALYLFLAVILSHVILTSSIRRQNVGLSSSLVNIRNGFRDSTLRSTKINAKQDKVAISWLNDGMKNGIASAIATILSKLIVQPFDTIKTIQQVQKVKVNMFETGRDLIAQRGVRALWSGSMVSAFGAVPAVALYYSLYSTSRKHLTKLFPVKYRPVAVALAASLSNTVASVLRVPYEVYKQRLQVGLHSTLFEAVQYSWKHEGISGLFGGGKLMSQIIRDVPYALFTAVAYDILQRCFQQHIYPWYLQHRTHLPSQVQDSVSGAIAGGIGTFLTNPQDVIKTRLMVDQQDGSIHPLSVVAASRMIWEKEGLNGFFVGASSRLVHKIPGNGFFFLFYEAFRYMLGAVQQHSEQ